MDKEKFHTMKYIRDKYPDEWVLIKDPIVDKTLTVKKGVVVAHAKTKKEVHEISMSLSLRSSACLYTGELLPKNFMFML